MYRFCRLLVSALFITQFCNAQEGDDGLSYIGFELGMNVSNMYISNLPSNVTKSFNIGARYGLLLDLSIGQGICLQPGAFVNTLGGTLSGTTQTNSGPAQETDKTVLTYLQFPLNVVYKFEAGSSGKAFVGAALYYSNHRSTRINVNLKQGNYSFDSTIYTEALGKNEVGIGIMGGYEFRNGIFFRLAGDVGFTNINQASGQTARNYCMRIDAGYLIKGRRNDNGGRQVKDRHFRYKQRR